MPAEFVPIAYISAPLGLTPEGVRRWCRAGQIPGARKVGLQWFIPRQTADDVIAGRVV